MPPMVKRKPTRLVPCTKPWYRKRRELLRRALGKDGFTLRQFHGKLDVSRTHLDYVLDGERPSQRIDVAVWMVIAHCFGEKIAANFVPGKPPVRGRRKVAA